MGDTATGRFTTRLMSRIVLAVAVLAGLFAVAALLLAPGTLSRPNPGTYEFDGDVASSWGRYNADVAEQEPSWSADDFLAAVDGAAPGGVVRMPGSATHLDAAALSDGLAGTDLLVVVTPPSPLGATETTRVRDNTVQKYWADDAGVQLIMVHGVNVYVPLGAEYGYIVQQVAAGGQPAVDSLVYTDATEPVLSAADFLLQRDPAPADGDAAVAAPQGGRRPMLSSRRSWPGSSPRRCTSTPPSRTRRRRTRAGRGSATTRSWRCSRPPSPASTSTTPARCARRTRSGPSSSSPGTGCRPRASIRS